MNRMCSRLRKAVGWRWAALALLPALQACQPTSTQQEAAAAEAGIPPPHEALDPLDTDGGKRIVLALTAFNYTERTINDYGVVGGGGGSMSPGQSGGIYAGGASIPRDIPWDLLEFKVRWTDHGCMRKMRYSNGEPYENAEFFYKEQTVRLKEPLPPKPDYLVLHFYPDDRIEAVITEHMPDPRVEVRASKEGPYPPCKERNP